MPHHVVNFCTTSSKVCLPSGVSANIEMSSMKPMFNLILNWQPCSGFCLFSSWSLPICKPWLIPWFCPFAMGIRNRALIKILKSCGPSTCGDVKFPCATPMSTLIVALSASPDGLIRYCQCASINQHPVYETYSSRGKSCDVYTSRIRSAFIVWCSLGFQPCEQRLRLSK